MKIGIIGCGKQADAHLTHVLRIPGCRVVGVCDSEILMAKQLAERFDVRNAFDSAEEMIAGTRPEVVHIVTPPATHYPLGRLCMEAECHAFIEKPFTIDYAEAKSLLALARNRGLKITAGHHHQFSDAGARVRKIVKSGSLGELVHMESTFGYDFSDQRFAKALLGDRRHWIRKLPGKLLHNVISHLVSKVSEFIEDDQPEVIARVFTSKCLQQMNEREIADELRVMIVDRKSMATAYLTFSSQISPIQHQLRLYGSRATLIADYEHETVIVSRRTNYKSYMKQIMVPFASGREMLAQALENIRRLAASTLSYESGRRGLFEAFYNSVQGKGPDPIPHREILLTSWIMDEIFSQVQQTQAQT